MWQYILCNTPDPRDPIGELEEIGELESARSKNLDIVRNRAGSASCSLSIHDEYATKIFDRIDQGDVRGSVRKAILVRRNKVDLWSGPIMTIRGSLQEGNSSFEIGCVGWLEYLFHRELYANKHYEDMAQDLIAFDLLAVANLQNPTHPVPIFPGVATGAMSHRSPTFNKGDTFGASLQKLSDVESGFDMDIDPRTRKLNLFAWDSYTIRDNIKLGYRWGPENIASINWDENGAATRNRFTAVGNNNIPFQGQDTGAQDEYGLFEETISLPIETSEILPGYVAAELVIRSRPQVTYTVVPKPVGLDTEQNFPRLFDDFFIGDQISFTAKEGFFEVKNQGIRIFGASISISDDNVETINTLQTSPTT